MPYVDDFSKQAQEYARYRPRYSPELFDFLAALAPEQTLALDCGTGSGQAALGLAAKFDKIIAIDASANQIANATRHPHIEYRVARADQTGLENNSVDLITVAQAMHWFDLDDFYAEARRTLKPGGVLAAWCYAIPETKTPVDDVYYTFFQDILGPYWSRGVEYVSGHYKNIPFPFDELQAPAYTLDVDWTMADLIGYFKSFSGRERFMEQRGFDPLDLIRDDLSAAWGDPQTRRTISWPLYFKIGR